MIPLVPPYVFWCRGNGQATVAVGTQDGGAVLIAPTRGYVIRTHATSAFNDNYERRRRIFEKHLPSPRFELVEGGRTLREEFVHGRYFFDLPLADRLEVTRNMLAGYESLTRAGGSSGSRALLNPVMDALAQTSPPEDFSALLRATLTTKAVRNWRRVPSASDPRPKNIVVYEDLVPVPIDIGRLRLDPFFYYPIGFVAHAGHGVRDAYLRGELDVDFDRLFAASGADYEADERGRLGLLAVRTLVAAYKECSPDGNFDVPRFNWVIERRWRSVLAPSPRSRSRTPLGSKVR